MDALVRHPFEPRTYVRIGRGYVQPQSGLIEGRCQRRDEAALQITIEAFNLAFGASAVGSAGAGDKAIALRHRQQPSIPAMTAFAVGIALDHDGLGVVEQDFLRNPTKVLASLFDAT